jgi:hypothetical protein
MRGMKNLNNNQFVLAAILIGIVGASAMIFITYLTAKGILQIFPIPLVMVYALYILNKKKHFEMNFIKSFLTGIIIYFLMVMIWYVFIICFISRYPSSLGAYASGLWYPFAGIITSSAFCSIAITSLFYLFVLAFKSNKQASV